MGLGPPRGGVNYETMTRHGFQDWRSEERPSPLPGRQGYSLRGGLRGWRGDGQDRLGGEYGPEPRARVSLPPWGVTFTLLPLLVRHTLSLSFSFLGHSMINTMFILLVTCLYKYPESAQ